ncbi:enoyl-CoA hydratase-related protein [Streptomyces sp. NPDC048473]|uniref:enoyl-CoA hydratase-related protein n=1 Tax=unclassified Streptomyces TaxID=2593676 RepID=UPI0037237CD2
MDPRITVREDGALLRITLDRPDRRNAMDAALVDALDAALDRAERSPDCRIVVLQGRDGIFCTGMDIAGAAQDTPADDEHTARRFFALMTRLTTVPRIVVALVDGQTTGGGVGLAAACDLMYAAPRSSFGLPEGLWGLLPCCVLPFLIRRAGRQTAYTMSLTTLPLSAADAERRGLVDAVDDDPETLLRRVAFRAGKVAPDVVGDLKTYLTRLRPMPPETEDIAVAELMRLTSSKRVRRNFDAFAADGTFPWQSSTAPTTRSSD